MTLTDQPLPEEDINRSHAIPATGISHTHILPGLLSFVYTHKCSKLRFFQLGAF